MEDSKVDLNNERRSFEDREDQQIESKNPVNSNIVGYNDGTTSEEDGNSGPEYNDLEGLD